MPSATSHNRTSKRNAIMQKHRHQRKNYIHHAPEFGPQYDKILSFPLLMPFPFASSDPPQSHQLLCVKGGAQLTQTFNNNSYDVCTEHYCIFFSISGTVEIVKFRTQAALHDYTEVENNKRSACRHHRDHLQINAFLLEYRLHILCGQHRQPRMLAKNNNNRIWIKTVRYSSNMLRFLCCSHRIPMLVYQCSASHVLLYCLLY